MLGKLLDSFHALGISGWPLLACTVIVITVFFERIFFLFIVNRPVNLKMDPSKVSHHNSVLYALVHEMQSIKSLPKENRDEIMSISFTIAKRQLRMGLGMLKFIAAIAPMFGILGNVLGMVNSFTIISQGNGSINPAMVSAGLKEAMYATSTGLMVAMPAMFFEYFFGYLANSRIDNYLNYINRLNVKIEINSHSEAKKRAQERMGMGVVSAASGGIIKTTIKRPSSSALTQIKPRTGGLSQKLQNIKDNEN